MNPSQQLPMTISDAKLQSRRQLMPLQNLPIPSSLAIVLMQLIKPLYRCSRWDANLVKITSKGCDNKVATIAQPKQTWQRLFISLCSHYRQQLKKASTNSMYEPREVRSLATEQKEAAGNIRRAISIFMLQLAICELILLMSIQVLRIPSATTPSTKLSCPKVRKHMFPMIMERQPLKKPKQVLLTMTLLASNLATSTSLFLAIFLTLMVSKGQAMRWMSEERTPVVITLWRMVGSFLT